MWVTGGDHGASFLEFMNMTMHKTLLAAFAVGALTSASAFAADLPARGVAPTPYIAPMPVFTWTGFYVGVNAGGAFNDTNRNLNPGGNFLSPAVFPAANLPFISGSGGNGANGFTGGLTVGYNQQFNQFVAGVEADFNYLSGRSRGDFTNTLPVLVPGAGAGPHTVTVSRGNNNHFFGTVRARLGFAIDRTLLYATGGLAYGGNNDSGSIIFTNGAGTQFANFTTSDSNRIGWTLGAGAEYAFTNNITAKLEYLYVDLGGRNRTYTDAANPGYTFTGGNGNKFHVVRAGLNYKF